MKTIDLCFYQGQSEIIIFFFASSESLLDLKMYSKDITNKLQKQGKSKENACVSPGKIWKATETMN